MEKYKRTKNDSPLRCPYCDHQFTTNKSRWFTNGYIDGVRAKHTKCRYCGESFWYINYSAKYIRETGKQCVFKESEVEYDRDCR